MDSDPIQQTDVHEDAQVPTYSRSYMDERLQDAAASVSPALMLGSFSTPFSDLPFATSQLGTTFQTLPASISSIFPSTDQTLPPETLSHFSGNRLTLQHDSQRTANLPTITTPGAGWMPNVPGPSILIDDAVAEESQESIIHLPDSECTISQIDITPSDDVQTHPRPRTTRRGAGKKLFQCPDCQQTFSKKSRFTSHYRSHTGEKPYVCAIGECKKAFPTISNFNRHIRDIHHGTTSTARRGH